MSSNIIVLKLLTLNFDQAYNKSLKNQNLYKFANSLLRNVFKQIYSHNILSVSGSYNVKCSLFITLNCTNKNKI